MDGGDIQKAKSIEMGEGSDYVDEKDGIKDGA